MKKIAFLFASLMLGMGLYAQDYHINIQHSGSVVYDNNVSDINQIHFEGNSPANMLIDAGSGYSVFPITEIDSITFAMQELPPEGDTLYIIYSSSSVQVTNPFANSGVTVSMSGSNVTVNSTMTNLPCIISGTSSNGSLTFYSTSSFYMILSSLSLTSTSTSAINIASNVDAALVLRGTSTLADGVNSSLNGTLYAAGNLTVSGNGTLQVTGNAKHGISVDGTLTVNSGEIEILDTDSDGIHGSSDLIWNGGLHNIVSAGSDGLDISGNVTIQNGELNINTTAEGQRGVKVSGIFTMNNGSLSINTSGTDSKGIKADSPVYINGGHLNMDNMPVSGFSRTYAVDRLITDSCAGGSALGTGVKTRYHYMGVDPDGNPVPTLLHRAQQKGMKTGVTVTCRINDATPLDFVGHSLDRDEEEINAAQYVDSGVDFLCGGGIEFWQGRSDGRDLVKEMVDKGYTFVDNLEDLNAVHEGRLLGLFAPLEMEPALDRGPVLEDSAMKAIELLDNKKGFFLMIEGSSIDDWCHRQKVGYMAEELFDFDRTVGKVLKWAEQDGQTLVVVTADHATGGLTLIDGSLPDRMVKVHFSTKGHNGILVPVFAYGPHAEEFTGVHENNEVSNIIRRLMK